MNKKFNINLILSIGLIMVPTLFSLSLMGNSDIKGSYVGINSETDNIIVENGFSHSAAIDGEGNLYTWGSDNYGQLGNDSVTGNVTIPTQIMDDGTVFTQVSLGYFHSAAIDEDGNLYTWGSDNHGQLGNGSVASDVTTPTQIMDDGTVFTQVSLGRSHSAVIDDAGNLYVWGRNNFGQIGNGGFGSEAKVLNPTQIMDDGTVFKQVSLSNYQSAAIDEDGNLYTWGYNRNGQLGNGTSGYDNYNVITPTQIMDDGTVFTQVSLGNLHSAAIDDEGNLYTWGANDYGQLGDGGPTNYYDYDAIPTQIMDDGTVFTQVSLGYYHSAAIDDADNLYTWGRNNSGQLGNGSETGNVATPIQIKDDGTVFTQVSLGRYHSAAIDDEGNLYTWGYSSDGQLGNGSETSNVATPTQVFTFTLPPLPAEDPTDFKVSEVGSDYAVFSWSLHDNDSTVVNGTINDGNNVLYNLSLNEVISESYIATSLIPETQYSNWFLEVTYDNTIVESNLESFSTIEEFGNQFTAPIVIKKDPNYKELGTILISYSYYAGGALNPTVEYHVSEVDDDWDNENNLTTDVSTTNVKTDGQTNNITIYNLDPNKEYYVRVIISSNSNTISTTSAYSVSPN